jgi:hypothetical protein
MMRKSSASSPDALASRRVVEGVTVNRGASLYQRFIGIFARK